MDLGYPRSQLSPNWSFGIRLAQHQLSVLLHATLLSQRTMPSLRQRQPRGYAHETANILDARLNRPGTSGQAYQETYGDSYQTTDQIPTRVLKLRFACLAACNIHEDIRMTKRLVNVSIFLICSIFFANCSVAQRIAATSESQDENTN